jgi:hypothetical protein
MKLLLTSIICNMQSISIKVIKINIQFKAKISARVKIKLKNIKNYDKNNKKYRYISWIFKIGSRHLLRYNTMQISANNRIMANYSSCFVLFCFDLFCFSLHFMIFPFFINISDFISLAMFSFDEKCIEIQISKNMIIW